MIHFILGGNFFSLILGGQSCEVEEGYGAGLNMTRSIGDLEAHRETGLIADPEVSVHQVARKFFGGRWVEVFVSRPMLPPFRVHLSIHVLPVAVTVQEEDWCAVSFEMKFNMSEP